MAYEQDSSICATGETPLILTGVFIQILRNLFSTPDNIENTNVKPYLWNKDPKLTRILIEEVYNWTPENIQQRPAILVKRQDWKTRKIAIADKIHGPPSETGFDEAQQLVNITGGHTMFCLGTTGAQAELIGTEVYLCLIGFSMVIREQFRLGLFAVSGIGAVTKFDECAEHFAVPVNVEYEFSHSWRLVRQSPEWMRTKINIVDE